MIALKDYQTRVLDSLREFCRECSSHGVPERAFQAIQLKNSQPLFPYIPGQATGLAAGMPYVCLRVPTGGGKTLLATYAAGIVLRELLHSDRGVVLWLVPSNTILEQTATALRDPRHDYRRSLELSVGAVEVVTIEEALRLSRATVDGATVVIVATIQSFRVEDITGRKVYEANSSFAEHISSLPGERLKDMLRGSDGEPTPSLVNMLRARRPIVIVDEAHNARTDLSFSTLGSVLPSCVIEFSATPARGRHPSNVLHHVSAAELKAASMVKLPLKVITRHPSQRDQLLSDALTLRVDLERLADKEAQDTGEYIRPILLVQAERVDGCEGIREQVGRDFGVPREQIKICVGTLDELPSADEIRSPTCPIRVVITVQKLREGWDCPFAYVLCSLRETRSATAMEQIVGRILRLPHAQLKRHPDLNCSYVFSVSTSVVEVLSELRDALQGNGFTATEAERIILPMAQGSFTLGLQARTVTVPESDMDVRALEAEIESLNGKVSADVRKGEITVVVPLSTEEAARLVRTLRTPEAQRRLTEAVKLVQDTDKAFGGSGNTRELTAYERNQAFPVPFLCVKDGDSAFEFDSTYLLDRRWALSSKDASLRAEYSPLVRPTMTTGIVDVGRRGDVETSVSTLGPESDFIATLHQHVLALGPVGDWQTESLVAWLDRHIEHTDIPANESAEFLRKVVRGLMAKFAIADVGVLAFDRFRLRDEIAHRIQEHRLAERKAAFQAFLLPETPLIVSELNTINFAKMAYEPSWVYEGSFQFKRHYFGPKPGELVEKTSEGRLTEEFRCAQFLDSMAETRFWVRNLARRSSSFRLQTSTDWFYPDFVCQLKGGGTLVVEYKGAHLWADAEEKRAIGAVWESRSGGSCLFVMPTGGDFAVLTTAARKLLARCE